MLAEFEQSLRQRIIDVKETEAQSHIDDLLQPLEEQTDEARERAEQAAWNRVFSAGETLLQEQGRRVGVGLKTSIGDKINMVAEIFSHGFPPPLDFNQASKIWGLEKDVDFDGKTQRVSIFARAKRRSAKDVDRMLINIAGVELFMTRPASYTPADVSVGLSLGQQLVSTDLSDANFFKEAITRIRQQNHGVASISPSPARATRAMRSRWII